MPSPKQADLFALQAEKLVQFVEALLAQHEDELVRALRESMTKDEAKAHIRQLDHLVQALDHELWRKGQEPSRALVKWVAKGLGGSLGAIGLAVATHASIQTYDDVTRARDVAEDVVVCVDHSLTEMERGVLQSIAKGLPDKTAARGPGISVEEYKSLKRSIAELTGVTKQADALHYLEGERLRRGEGDEWGPNGPPEGDAVEVATSPRVDRRRRAGTADFADERITPYSTIDPAWDSNTS